MLALPAMIIDYARALMRLMRRRAFPPAIRRALWLPELPSLVNSRSTGSAPFAAPERWRSRKSHAVLTT